MSPPTAAALGEALNSSDVRLVLSWSLTRRWGEKDGREAGRKGDRCYTQGDRCYTQGVRGVMCRQGEEIVADTHSGAPTARRAENRRGKAGLGTRCRERVLGSCLSRINSAHPRDNRVRGKGAVGCRDVSLGT